MRRTVVYIGTVAIGLTVIEMSEEAEARYVNGEYVRLTDYVPKRRGRYAHDHGWTSTHHFPTGRLCLQAYSLLTPTSFCTQTADVKVLAANKRAAAPFGAAVRGAQDSVRSCMR
jgi:hypothetical protein